MRLGRYEVVGPIGSGGFGRVWLARDSEKDNNSSNLVAIKRLRRTRSKKKPSPDEASRMERAFKYEAEIGSYLVHPNIVRIIELAKVEKDYLLVMEYVDGLGVDELISHQRRNQLSVPADVALEITVQAGRGLHYAHSVCSADGRPLHIVHRDVKPSNIMISRKGRVQVMDFGVARSVLQPGQTASGTIKGTLRYLSPEQAKGGTDIGPATDQFALGLVLGELLTGHPVYNADRDHKVLFRALRGEVGAAVASADRACPGIGPILARALDFSPKERFQTLGEFVAALESMWLLENGEAILASWVERCRKERSSRQAARQNSVGNGDAPVFVDLEGESDQGDISMSYPVGWVQEQFSTFDEHGEAGDESPDVEIIIEDGTDTWESGLDSDISTSILAQRPNETEGWAMIPVTQEEIDLDLLQRGPPTDEFLLPPKSKIRKGKRGKSSIVNEKREQVEVAREAAASTLYSMKNPGRDRVGATEEHEYANASTESERQGEGSGRGESKARR